MKAIREVFNLWYEKGFLRYKEMVLYFLVYISQTQDIGMRKLRNMMDKSNKEGGDIMETLAQQIINKHKAKLIKAGKKEALRETARRMLLNNFSVDQVITVTGLTKKEVKTLIN